MHKIEVALYYFKVVIGSLIILIGFWIELNLLFEIKNRKIPLTYGVDQIITNRLFADENDFMYEVEEIPINQNFHILIGLGMLTGAILLSTRNSTIKK